MAMGMGMEDRWESDGDGDAMAMGEMEMEMEMGSGEGMEMAMVNAWPEVSDDTDRRSLESDETSKLENDRTKVGADLARDEETGVWSAESRGKFCFFSLETPMEKKMQTAGTHETRQ